MIVAPDYHRLTRQWRRVQRRHQRVAYAWFRLKRLPLRLVCLARGHARSDDNYRDPWQVRKFVRCSRCRCWREVRAK